MDFFNTFSSFPVINISDVSLFIDAENKRPRRIILYKTFFYLFSTFKILSSSILICIGFSPPAISKFCCAQIIIVSIGWAIGTFNFFFYRGTLLKNCILSGPLHWEFFHLYLLVETLIRSLVFFFY